jgi:hypothetical protein
MRLSNQVKTLAESEGVLIPAPSSIGQRAVVDDLTSEVELPVIHEPEARSAYLDSHPRRPWLATWSAFFSAVQFP